MKPKSNDKKIILSGLSNKKLEKKQSLLKYKPKSELEVVLDEINKNTNFGQILNKFDKQILRMDSITNPKHEEAEESDEQNESMRRYLEFVNSKNKIEVFKMIQDRNIEELVRLKKNIDQKENKNLEDDIEENKKFITIQKNKFKEKFNRKNKNNYNKLFNKDLFSKTHFNAANIVANHYNISQINTKYYENFYKNLKDEKNKKNPNKKNLKSYYINNEFQDDKSSRNNSLIIRVDSPKKNEFMSSFIQHPKNIPKTSQNNKRPSNNEFLEKKNNHNKTTSIFFSGNNNQQNKMKNINNSEVEKVISKLKSNFSLDNDNLDFIEINPLLFNLNNNSIKNKKLEEELIDPNKLEYLRKIAFTSNRTMDIKIFIIN